MFEIEDVLRLREAVTSDIEPFSTNNQRFAVFSEFSAANLYLFRKTYSFTALDDGPFLAKGTMRDGRKFYLPKPTVSLGIKLPDFRRSSGNRYIYPMVAMQNLDALDERASRYTIDQADYIYSHETFASFPGPSFRRERQGMRGLLRRHDCEFRPTEPTDVEILEKWLSKKSLPAGEADSSEFREAIEKLNLLGLHGISAVIDGQVCGVVVFDTTVPGTIIVLFAKTVHRSAYLLHLLYKELASTVVEGSFINLCQDLGLPGLRRKKTLLRPLEIKMKHAVMVAGATVTMT